ncbi:FCD domain-containing protein [Aurantibacter sp.]|uniref:FadR/GntR family transcriptional regulator n=1 Tax=Aurantibacter sp. TaxID=2807103 RepID=UPI0032642402
MSVDKFKNLGEINLETSVDTIVNQINELITSGQLIEGDKIPSERFLSEKYQVGRMFVRDALSKLEFYGILKKKSSGVRVVAGNKHSALITLTTNVVNLLKPDYKSLMEVRNVLEIESVGLAAERREQHDIDELEKAIELLGNKVSANEAGIEEDLMFHIGVAKASKNNVIIYLVSYLVSHMINFSKKYDICRDSRPLKAYNEHVVILEHIKNGDSERAKQSMREHLSTLFDFIPESEIK